MMKITPLFLLLVAQLTTVSAQTCSGSHSCDCFTCDKVIPREDGTLDVTIGHCKAGSISWMCCTGVSGPSYDNSACDVIGPCGNPEGPGEAKCNGIDEGQGLVINIPADATSFEINTHDGKTAGDGDNQFNVCGGQGNQGGSCVKKGFTAHCLNTYTLEGDCGYSHSDEPVRNSVSIDPEPAPTPSQTDPAPTPAVPGDDPMEPTSRPGTQGDPHFKTHTGEMYDFHGGCDLVLLDNPDFHNGLGMLVHIRTKIETWWSKVESAAVRIGDETIEMQEGALHINGAAIDLDALVDDKFTLIQFAGLTLRYMKSGPNLEAKIYLNGEKVQLKTFKGFVKVQMSTEDSAYYKGSSGLLGRYTDGKRVARDGETFLEDVNVYGKEWQVTAEEPKLFHSYDDAWVVLADQTCAMPETTEAKQSLRNRRLANGMATHEAEKACAHLESADDRAACVFDVVSTQDLEMAGAW